MHTQAGSDSTLSIQNLSYANGDHGFDHLLVVGTTHIGDVSYGNRLDGFSFEGQGDRAARVRLHLDRQRRGDRTLQPLRRLGLGDRPHVERQHLLEPVRPARHQVQQGRLLESRDLFLGDRTGHAQYQRRPAVHLARDRGLSPAGRFARDRRGEHRRAGWPGSDFEGFPPIDDAGTANAGIGPVEYADRGAFEYGSTGIVGIPDPSPLPTTEIEGVAPNPLSGRGRLAFRIAQPGPVTVDLYDARGRKVRALVDHPNAPAGWFTTPIETDSSLPAGLYLYRVRAADGERAGKFVVVR
jgi:hypothetical protein